MRRTIVGLGALALAVAACSGAATAPADDAVEIPPLVEDEDVEIPSLVEPSDDVPLEPLIPGGTDLAEAYRVEVRHAYTAAHDVAIARDRQRGDDYYVGDLVWAGNDRYEGRIVAIAGLEQDVAGMDGSTCHISWVGRQIVEAVGIVRTAESLGAFAPEGDDEGGVYLPIYLTQPAGPVDWSDPDDDCGGVASEWLPISWGDPDSSSALGGATPRLPPPGFGKIEERIDYTGPGFFGDTTYEWVFTITPIDAVDAREPSELTGEGIEIPPLTDD